VKTLADVTTAHGFEVLEHLEADAEVPVYSGLQAQGDLFIVPAPARADDGDPGQLVPPAGIAVIEAIAGGHEHRLFAGTAGTAFWFPNVASGRQSIGVLECTEPAFVLHPEHGATGVAPGVYEFRRQREQAQEERLVAD
jgi:hypothetical protein